MTCTKGVVTALSERELFEKFKWDVYKTCFYMLHDQHEAEDMTQNVFIKVFSQDYQRIENTKSWLITITMNMCRNHLKRSSKVIVVDEFLENPSHENVESDYELKQLRHEMVELLSQLPERTKSVIVLKYLHDLKNKEIAEMLNITEGTVKASCHYGLKLLRGYMTHKEGIDTVREGIR
jgi:RNA polymerase sigma-70 factor, ECF subfamily